MKNNPFLIRVSIDEQRLQLIEAGRVVMDVAIATASNGPGERIHSECTPRGRHRIRAKIGDGCAPNTVFISRRPTGELYTPELKRQHPKRDWILTRILWLCGEEPGKTASARWTRCAATSTSTAAPTRTAWAYRPPTAA